MALLVNPYASAMLEREGSAIVGVTVRAPIRGRGLQTLRAHHQRDRVLFKTLFALLVRKTALAPFDGAMESLLVRAGVLAAADELPRRLPERFSCPVSAGAVAEGSAVLQVLPAPPSEIAERVGDLSALSAARPIAWIEDPRSAALLPYWPGPETIDPLALRADVAAPPLGDQDAARAQLARDGHAILRRALPRAQVSALARYYRVLAEEGFFQQGDGQSTRWVLENEGVARWLQRQLAPLAGRLAGEPLQPSFAYVGAYHTGDELAVHRDRPQCELSFSLLVDYDPPPAGDSRWPLLVQTTAGEVACHQGLGDAIVYRGCELPHRRGPLLDRRSVSLLLFYVPRGFAGPLD